MDYYGILKEFYKENSLAWNTLVVHSRMVMNKALHAAKAYMKKNPDQKQPDLELIKNGSMLHDIGIFRTKFPKIGLNGDLPYLMHGVVGRQILEQKGFHDLAFVCERHVGVGITAREIREKGLPLPERDMLPISLEEKIICYADKFFSKDPGKLEQEKSIEAITGQLERFGKDRAAIFLNWHEMFSDNKE